MSHTPHKSFAVNSGFISASDYDRLKLEVDERNIRIMKAREAWYMSFGTTKEQEKRIALDKELGFL